MDPIFGTALVTGISKVIDYIFPNKAEQDAAKLKVLELQMSGELAKLTADTELAKGQMAINQEEAKHENLFVSGWRPFVGWTCGLGFFAKYLGGPLVFVIAQFFDVKIVLPEIDVLEMMPLLFGMLGLGAYRTYEKTKK